MATCVSNIDVLTFKSDDSFGRNLLCSTSTNYQARRPVCNLRLFTGETVAPRKYNDDMTETSDKRNGHEDNSQRLETGRHRTRSHGTVSRNGIFSTLVYLMIKWLTQIVRKFKSIFRDKLYVIRTSCDHNEKIWFKTSKI